LPLEVGIAEKAELGDKPQDGRCALRGPALRAGLASGEASCASSSSRPLIDPFAEASVANLQGTFRNLPEDEFSAIVEMMCDRRRSVHLIGGRFTDALARYLASRLSLVRPDVRHARPSARHQATPRADRFRYPGLLEQRPVLDLAPSALRRQPEDPHALRRGSLMARPDVSARSVRLHKLELNNARLAGHGDDDAW
jgi:hypothetical protein